MKPTKEQQKVLDAGTKLMIELWHAAMGVEGISLVALEITVDGKLFELSCDPRLKKTTET